MKKHYLFTFILSMFLLFPNCISAQVGINAGNADPDPSAGLDVNFPDKGFLPPRVSLVSTNAADPIVGPAAGLLVYNIAGAGVAPYDVKAGYYCWSGVQWNPVLPPPGTNIGDMQYWNGLQWVVVPAGAVGQVLTFQTPTGALSAVPMWTQPVCSPNLPVVVTDDVSNITLVSAAGGGNLSDGGAPVTARGICWSTVPNPTVDDSHTTDGAGPGPFTSSMTGLSVFSIYYVRAYATNSIGTAYGNQVSFQTLSFAIGLAYQGGIIIYLDETLQHGIISATTDQGVGGAWGCYGFAMGTSPGIGTGQANTTAIVNGCGTAGIAARICDDLVLNGYDDWYLPSRDELYLMYLQRDVIGGFAVTEFWSSSEDTEVSAPAYFAHYVAFYDGGQHWADKRNEHYVRAVRSF
jgi:hypothetical protein